MVLVLFTSNATTDARLFTPSREPGKDIRRRLNEWRGLPITVESLRLSAPASHNRNQSCPCFGLGSGRWTSSAPERITVG